VKSLRGWLFPWRTLGRGARSVWTRLLRRVGLGDGSYGADAPHATPPRPASGMEVIRRKRGLRRDGPHHGWDTKSRIEGPDGSD